MTANRFCVICFQPVPYRQNTCGARECLESWKFLGRDARLKHKNLASMSPSERAFCLSQGPSPDELEAQEASRKQLDNEVEEYQAAQQKKVDSGFMPKSLRDMLIANAPVVNSVVNSKKEEIDPDGDTIAPDATSSNRPTN